MIKTPWTMEENSTNVIDILDSEGTNIAQVMAVKDDELSDYDRENAKTIIDSVNAVFYGLER